MILVVRVRLVVEGNPARPISGVGVALFDRDETDEDDFLAKGITGDHGEARLVFDSDRYTDKEDQPAWRLESMPDLFVKVYNGSGTVIYSTRDRTAGDKLPDLIVVELPEDLIDREDLRTG